MKEKDIALRGLRRAKELYRELSKKNDEDRAVMRTIEDLYGRDGLTPAKRTFIDLGLPSGVLWADENEDGYFSFDEAQEKFGELMPKCTDFAELYQECKWKWDDDRHGYTVTGPNGNYIFLPAAGYRNSSNGNLYAVAEQGRYWSAIPSDTNSGMYLYFDSGSVTPTNYSNRAYGFSVRAVKRR